MKLKELLDIFKDLDQEADVDELLKTNTNVAGLFPQKTFGYTDFETFATSNPQAKQYIESYADRRVNSGIETFKNGAMQEIIRQEVDKASGKKKSPLELKMEELEKKLAEQEKVAAQAQNETKVRNLISNKFKEAQIPADIDRIYPYIGNGVDLAETRVDNLVTMMDEFFQEKYKSELAKGNYTPPTGTEEDNAADMDAYVQKIMFGDYSALNQSNSK